MIYLSMRLAFCSHPSIQSLRKFAASCLLGMEKRVEITSFMDFAPHFNHSGKRTKYVLCKLLQDMDYYRFSTLYMSVNLE